MDDCTLGVGKSVAKRVLASVKSAYDLQIIGRNIDELCRKYHPIVAAQGGSELAQRFSDEHLMEEFLCAPFANSGYSVNGAIARLMLDVEQGDCSNEPGYEAIRSFLDEYERLLLESLEPGEQTLVALRRIDSSRPFETPASQDGAVLFDDAVRWQQLMLVNRLSDRVVSFEHAASFGEAGEINRAINLLHDIVTGLPGQAVVLRQDEKKLTDSYDAFMEIYAIMVRSAADSEDRSIVLQELINRLQVFKDEIEGYRSRILSPRGSECCPPARRLRLSFERDGERLRLTDSAVFQLVCYSLDNVQDNGLELDVGISIVDVRDCAYLFAGGNSEMEKNEYLQSRLGYYADSICESIKIMLRDSFLAETRSIEDAQVARCRRIASLNKSEPIGKNLSKAIGQCSLWVSIAESIAGRLVDQRASGFSCRAEGAETPLLVDVFLPKENWYFLSRLDDPNSNMRGGIRWGGDIIDVSRSDKERNIYPDLYFSIAHAKMGKTARKPDELPDDEHLLNLLNYRIGLH